MSEYKLPDPKKWAGRVVGALIVGTAFYFALPYLLTIAWGAVELGIAFGIAGVLGLTLLSKKFWSRVNVILGGIGYILFKWFVQMDPWAILSAQVDKAESDLGKLKAQVDTLRGQESKMKKDIDGYIRTMREAQASMDICEETLKSNPNDIDTQLALQSATVEWNGARTYVESTTPIYNDVIRLSEFFSKAYKKGGYAIKDARMQLKMQKDTYDAVTAGVSAAKRAMAIFQGDQDWNEAGRIALEAVAKDVAQKVGTIRNSIEITSQIMNEKDLKDASKVRLALQQSETINLDTLQKDVSAISINNVQQTNKYLNYKK